MIYIVNVSGGLASFEALYRTIERYGKLKALRKHQPRAEKRDPPPERVQGELF
jgi:hypothetical protein